MPFESAVCLTCIATAVLLIRSKTGILTYLSQFLVIGSGLFALYSLIVYFYLTTPFQLNIGIVSAMAIHSSLLIIVAGFSFLFARPLIGMMRTISSEEAGGGLIRRVLPFVIVIPIALGWLKYLSESKHIMSSGLGVALVALANLTLTSIWLLIFTGNLNRSDAALRASEIHYGKMIKMVHLPLFHVNKDGKIDFINDRFIKVYGYTMDDILTFADWWNIAFPEPDYRSRVTTEWNTAVQRADAEDRDIDPFESRVVDRNGKEHVVEISGINQGEEFLATFIDITERKLSEKVIQDNEKRFRELIELLPQLFWTCRVDGPCDYLSRQWVEYTGIPEAEQLGYRWLEQLHPEDKDRTVSEWAEKVKTGVGFDIEFRIRRNDGVYHWFKTRAVPMRDAEGIIIKWFGSNTDIDGIKKAENEIKMINAELEDRVTERTSQLEAANKELESFSYTVSHDLRAPLRHIDGFVGLLVKESSGVLSEKGEHFLNTISDSARQMGMLIDDLLKFSRCSRAEMHWVSLEMNQSLQEALTLLKDVNSGRTIEWAIGDLPVVQGDHTLFRQVWVNLLENAVKFTRTKKVAKIGVSARDEGKEYVFAVKDNGAGFDMKYAGKLFGVFQRLHTQDEFEGTGIGLATVQRIVSRHGGRVWAESGLNTGSTFYFTLPKILEEKNV